uniref:RING-type domain-containing protein n=1 Tax=Ficedula albicollis TaxID=59894 RepID=A0A803V859_FICAL
MARENYSNCLICQDTPKDVASALPCQHQFCLGCILRWTQTNPSCPLCRTPIETKLEDLHVEKNPILGLCKCILFLPQMNILIFKISLKIEDKISSSFISINCVKTLIIALLVWINKCLNES